MDHQLDRRIIVVAPSRRGRARHFDPGVMKIVRGYTGAYVYRQIETLQTAGMLRLEEMSSEVVILNVGAIGSIRSLLISRSRVRIPTGSP